MKSIIKILTISLLILNTSCTGWLDLRPESKIVLEDFWMSEEDVQAVLASCYRGLTEEAVIYRMIVWGELRSDNMIEGSGFPNERYPMKRILDGDLVPTNAYSQWGSFYSVINYCNTILHYAPLVLERDNNFTTDDLNRVKAEVLTIRALSYFYLVRAFKEVPWVEKPTIDDGNDGKDYQVQKNTERTIIDNIIRDLKIARQYARTEYGNKKYNKGKITLDAVNALLADVYLWDEQYQNCIESCNQVLGNTKLKLVNQALAYSQVFYFGNSDESIFELQFDEDNRRNNALFELYGSNTQSLGEVSFPVPLAYDAFRGQTGAYSPFNYKLSSTFSESVDDIRAKDAFWQTGGSFFIYKYVGNPRRENVDGSSVYSLRSSTPNWIIYRLPEVLLMKAEALTQLEGQENQKQALKLVNQVYLRSNESVDSLQFVNYSTKAEMESLVLRERHREFLFEGKRWFDLVRYARRSGNTSILNDFVDHKSTGNTVSLGAPVLDAMYMPIAKSELSANPNLEQNLYYKESGETSSR